MKFSQAQQATSDALINAEMYTGHLDLLRGSVVELTGTIRDNQVFTGTGVVCRVDSDKAFILTATHNLHIASAGNRNTGEYVSYFKEKVVAKLPVRPGFDAPVAGLNAKIEDVSFPMGTVASPGYDVALLTVTRQRSRGFHAVATDLITPGGPEVRFLYASTAWRNHRQNGDPQKPFLDLPALADAKCILRNGADPHSDYVDADLAGWLLLQFGCGKGDTDHNARTQRGMKVAGLRNKCFIADTHEHFVDVFTFDTDDTNTSRQGDSGGPIFAVSPDGTRSYLIGVNLGANFYADKSDDSDATKNNAFSVISSDKVTL
jgi:hypothetical protein